MCEGLHGTGDPRARYPGLAEWVLAEIRERGALGSRDFTGKRDPSSHRVGTSSETMWSWKPPKQMLDALFAAGELVITDRVNSSVATTCPNVCSRARCSTPQSLRN